MTPQRWDRARRLFGEAVELPVEERTAFLEREAADDPQLIAEVQALLRSHESPGALLDRKLPFGGALSAAIEPRVFGRGELVVGRFRVVDFIGQGGMGEVYEAEDIELKTRVALKTVRTELAADEAVRERFRREILLARAVTHPNVCRLFDGGIYERPGHPAVVFLTMELLRGETLAARLASGKRYSASELLPLVRQLTSGLEAAHAAGVLHRDLKSDNIVLTPASDGAERAVVTDFGLARAAGPRRDWASAETGPAIGTPAYMAPEQIEGRSAGPAADIYALGVVLYESVTGRRPFTEASPLALAARKVRDAPPPPRDFAPDLDANCQEVILRCLAIDPAQRFQRAGDVLRALESPGIAQRVRMRMVLAAAVTAAAVLGAFAWLPISPATVPLSGEAARWYRQGVDALHAGAPWRASTLLGRVTAEAPGHPLAHARLAQAYEELDMADRAKDEMLKAADAAPNRSRLSRAERLELEAAQAAVLLQFDKSATRYQELAAMETGDRKAGHLLDRGRVLERNGETDEAIRDYRAAAALDRQNAAAQLRLAILAGQKADLPLAATHFQHADANYRLSGDFEGVAETLLQRSAIFRFARRLDESRSLAEQALRMASTTGNPEQQIRARFELATIAISDGRLDVAEREAAATLEQARAAGLENLTVAGLNDLARAYLTQYKLEEAEETLRQAMELAKRTRSLAGQARASYLMGSTLQRSGQAGRAMPFIESALTFYRQGGYRVNLAATLNLMADAYLIQGEYKRSADAAAAVRTMFEEMHDVTQATVAAERFGEIFTLQGDLPAAIRVYQAAENSHRSMGMTWKQLYAKANRADLLCRMGRAREGLEALSEVERDQTPLGDGAKSLAMRVFWIRAAEALARRDFVAAQQFAGRVLSMDKGGGTPYRRLTAQSIQGLAKVYSGERRAGRQLCDAVYAQARNLTSTSFRAEALVAAAEAALAAGDAGGANTLGFAALTECERLGEEELAYRSALIAGNAAAGAGSPEILRQAQNAAAQHASVLSRLWGPDAFRTYQARPDLMALRSN